MIRAYGRARRRVFAGTALTAAAVFGILALGNVSFLVSGYAALVAGFFGLMFLAADVSPKTAERLRFAVEGLADVEPLPLTQDDLAPVSHKRVAVFAVADANLARLCETKRKQCLDLDMKEEVSE